MRDRRDFQPNLTKTCRECDGDLEGYAEIGSEGAVCKACKELARREEVAEEAEEEEEDEADCLPWQDDPYPLAGVLLPARVISKSAREWAEKVMRELAWLVFWLAALAVAIWG